MLIWIVVLLVVLLDVSLFCILGSKINNLRDELLGEHFRYRRDFTKEILSEVHRVSSDFHITNNLQTNKFLESFESQMKVMTDENFKHRDALVLELFEDISLRVDRFLSEAAEKIEKLEKLKYGAY